MKKKHRYGKKYKKKNRRSVVKACKVEDRHHILWMRRSWAKVPSANKLRNHWYMIILIPKNTLHAYIHQQVKSIPVPREITAAGALRQLELLEQYGAIHETDDIQRRLMIIMALFECCEPATYAALKAQSDAVRKFYDETPG